MAFSLCLARRNFLIVFALLTCYTLPNLKVKAAMLEIRLLGTFDVRDGENILNISSRPAQSLFAYLVLSAGTSHRREKLAGMLWPDSLEETARSNLRHALWRIRKAIPAMPGGDHLLTDDLSIAFNASSQYWLDVEQVEKLGEDASVDHLMTALAEYRGELLPGFYEDWVLLAREHVASVFEHHMARLLALFQEQQRWPDTLYWAERWIELGQKPETAYRALMSAHAARGEMSRVAAAYERCVKSLKEFGIEPSENTQALYRRLKSGKEESRAVASLPVEEKRELKRSHLPIPLTSFIGREKEVDEVVRMVQENRLVTLLGSGGVGKTRLAIQASKKLSSQFQDGIWWVDLIGLNDGLLVSGEVARVLELSDSSNRPVTDLLVDKLGSRQILLVLDNCEHLISACAQLADRLLGSCENLKILATSREALDIFGESAWHVPSLSVPGADSSLQELDQFESVGLFLERAKVLQPQFRLTDQNAKPLAQICQRLGGIPLAIELAAARVKMMNLDEIASRLDDRFELLKSGSRAALPRHQTLRATIDWSYDLLTQPERILFQRLAVFAGGFTLAGAEAVCGFRNLKHDEILDLLGRLVVKSLVVVEQTPTSTTRYRMLETIHEYARQKLEEGDESSEVRNHHLEFFVRLAEQAEQNTFGTESVRYHRLLDEELDEIRGAMEWAIHSRQAAMAFRLSAALYYFWYNRRLLGSEWKEQLDDALPLLEGMERTSARAKALNAMGFLYWADVIPVNPRSKLEEALSIGNELGDKLIIAQSLCNLGLIALTEGRYSDAHFFFRRSLDLFQDLGFRNKEYIWSLTFLGDVVFHLNDLENARKYYEQSTQALRGLGDRNFLAYAVRRLAQLYWYCGEYDKATLLCRESLLLNQELGDFRGVVACLAAYGGIATARGDMIRAARLFGAVETLLNSMHIRLVYMDRLERERNLSILYGQADTLVLDQAWKEGALLSVEQAVAFALQ
jgi:predicted ATPase/DNA-binding SARP family transcriptional activator